MEQIGLRLKNARRLLKKSQEELAKNLKISKQAVSNMENGKSAPSISTLTILVKEFDINLNYIVAGIGDIMVAKQENLKALRESLLADVEKMLDSRGIL